MARIMLIEPSTETREGVMRILASLGSNKVNWKFPPLDLLGVGGILRKNGIEDFEILDALNQEMTHQQTKEIIAREQPELVAFTFTIYTIENDMKTATITKQAAPDARTLAINFAAESYPGDIMADFPDLDFLAYHEPEYPILDLVRANYDPRNVAGLCYRDNGQVKKNPERPLVNLEDIGIMTHDKIPLEIYRAPYQRRSPMSATSFTRGCINMCTHCIGARYLCLEKGALPGGGHLRLRPLDNIMEEFDLLQSLGVKELRFFDGELTGDMDWAETIFEAMIDQKVDITFSCNARADTVRESLLRKMKKAGCHLVSLGVDSTSQAVLDSMKKNLTVQQINEAIRMIRHAGLRLSTFTTFGHAAETRETMLQTIRFIKKINPDLASFSIAVPVKGTEFYEYLEENGYLHRSAPLSAYDPNLPPVYSYPWLSSEQMYSIAMKGYRSFYLRPKYLAKRLFVSRDRLADVRYLWFFLQRYAVEPIKRRWRPSTPGEGKSAGV